MKKEKVFYLWDTRLENYACSHGFKTKKEAEKKLKSWTKEEQKNVIIEEGEQ